MAQQKHVAIYAGSFDPFTRGHLDIAHKALSVFDELIILVAESPNKKSFLTRDERLSLIAETFSNERRVKVDSWDGLLVDYAKEQKAQALVRGLRPTGDFEIEYQMAAMNKKLHSSLETVFFITGENLYYISSSLVKEVFKHHGDIKPFLPESVAGFIEENESVMRDRLKKH